MAEVGRRKGGRGRITFEQRQELHKILHWLRMPVASQQEYLIKKAVRHFIDGEDAEAELLKLGITPWYARHCTAKARTVLGNERMKRRYDPAVKEARLKRQIPKFTSENFGVTIDNSQNRNYGMVSISIYCIVEVWTGGEDENVEREYLINFSDFKTKEWLTRLLVWALMNKREVLIKPATEHEMNSMKMFIPSGKADR